MQPPPVVPAPPPPLPPALCWPLQVAAGNLRPSPPLCWLLQVAGELMLVQKVLSPAPIVTDLQVLGPGMAVGDTDLGAPHTHADSLVSARQLRHGACADACAAARPGACVFWRLQLRDLRSAADGGRWGSVHVFRILHAPVRNVGHGVQAAGCMKARARHSAHLMSFCPPARVCGARDEGGGGQLKQGSVCGGGWRGGSGWSPLLMLAGWARYPGQRLVPFAQARRLGPLPLPPPARCPMRCGCAWRCWRC